MRMMTKLICAAFLFSLAMPTLVLAQDEEAAPNLASVWVVHPMEGHFNEFMAAAAEHVAFRKAQGDSRAWEGFQPAMGDDIGKVAFRYCCFDWADEDTYLAADDEKGLGAHWNENVDPHVAHYEHYFTAVDYDNSHWNEGASESATLFGVTEWYIAPGNSGDFNDMKEKMSTLAKEHGWASEETNWLWYSRIGGKPVEAIVIPHENYADMAPPEKTFYEFAVEQMGEEDADKMFEKFSKSSRGSSYTVWRRVPELTMGSGE